MEKERWKCDTKETAGDVIRLTTGWGTDCTTVEMWKDGTVLSNLDDYATDAWPFGARRDRERDTRGCVGTGETWH